MTEQQKDRLRELACDNCHWPYACSEDDLMKHCDACELAAEIEDLE